MNSDTSSVLPVGHEADPSVSDGSRRSAICCPHCGGDINFTIWYRADVAPTKIERWYLRLPAEDKRLVDGIRSSGMLSPFIEATKESIGTGDEIAMPERSFLAWLRSAAKRPLSGQSELYFVSKYRASTVVAMFGGSGVVAILADSIIREFLPLAILNSVNGFQLKGGKVAMGAVTQEHQAIDRWVKSRRGYVPASAVNFIRELNQRSIGAFERLGP